MYTLVTIGVVLSLVTITFLPTGLLAAFEEKISDYKNPDLGFSFQYPSEWIIEPSDNLDCLNFGVATCYIILKISPDNSARISILVQSIEFSTNCKCKNLLDYANFTFYRYYDALEPKILNQNDTKMGDNPARQSEVMKHKVSSRSLIVASINGNLGYLLDYSADTNPIYLTYLPKVQNLLKSISFTSDQPTAGEGVKILSSSEFNDDLGYVHVVGEIMNNTPDPAEFVKVVGTFYDDNNQVVATSFAYTNPPDLSPRDKAPFELIVTSASIPLSQIDHYRIVASYQK